MREHPSAHQDGAQAFKDGILRSACPHPLNLEASSEEDHHFWWLAGWDDAQFDAMKTHYEQNMEAARQLIGQAGEDTGK